MPTLEMAAITACYDEHPIVTGPAARVAMLLKTDIEGAVIDAQALASSRLPVGMAACLEKAVRAWLFPQVRAARVRVPLERWSSVPDAFVGTMGPSSCSHPNVMWPCMRAGPSIARLKVRLVFDGSGKAIAAGVVASSTHDENLHRCFETKHLECPAPQADPVGAHTVQDFEDWYDRGPAPPVKPSQELPVAARSPRIWAETRLPRSAWPSL